MKERPARCDDSKAIYFHHIRGVQPSVTGYAVDVWNNVAGRDDQMNRR